MHILWTGFVVYKIPGSGIFSGVFRIWKMWMCQVCGAGPGLFSGVFMILKMWVHQVYGTRPGVFLGILKM